MKISVKLMASLRTRLPPGSQGGKAELELDAGANLGVLLEKLGIAGNHVHLIMVNGDMERDHARPLAEGDEIVIFPPVAGG